MSDRTMLITHALLAERGACDEYLERFQELFPRGVEPTVALAHEHALRFDWSWANTNLLEGEVFERTLHEQRVAKDTFNSIRTQAWHDWNASDRNAEDTRKREVTIQEAFQVCRQAMAESFVVNFLRQGGTEAPKVRRPVQEGWTLRVTEEWLRTKGACGTYRDRFKSLFPEGVEVAVSLAAEHARDFDWEWAIESLLESEWEDKAVEVMNTANRIYFESRNALMAHRRAQNNTSSAWDWYDKKIEEARMTYYIACATAFADAFMAQGGRELMEDERP